ncbi:MAG TPA: histidine kinase, partial [Ilumatobacteraceae bacterium]
HSGLPLSVAADHVVSDLVLGGEPVARVHHRRGSRLPDLETVLDPVGALILQKERLTAQLAARVQRVTAERAELVRASLSERRALERDLHDGVQQELLALGLDIRLVLGSHPLDSALADVHEAVEQVRAISQGVSPPMLTTRGLGPAVAALVRRRGMAVDIGAFPRERLLAEVERAAYAVVAEALVRGATSVSATVDGGALHVITDGARPGVDGVLPDLIAAIGGTLVVTGSRVETVLPCETEWVPLPADALPPTSGVVAPVDQIVEG